MELKFPKIRNWKLLLAATVGCEVAGASGSLFTMPQITTWYALLQKPWFTPPNWVFGPVWTTLFLLMGVSLYLVLMERKKDGAQLALGLFTAQFALNVLWSVVFFGMRSPLYGLAVIIPLWVMILATILQFRKVDRNAALMLVPYICWVSVATALNYSVWAMNAAA